MTMAKDSLRIEGAEEMDGGMRLLVPRLKENGKLLVGKYIREHMRKLKLTFDSSASNITAVVAHPATAAWTGKRFSK